MASSTSRPIASTMANMVSVLIVKPRRRQHAEGAQQHHRHRDGRDQRRPEVLQEQEHDQEDQHDRLEQRLHHLLDRQLDERRRVVGVDDFDAGGEVAAEAPSIARLTASAVSSALAPVARLMPRPAAGLPL